METLPDELLILLLVWLPAQDICQVSLASRRFHAVATNDSLWRAVFEQRWSTPPKSRFRVMKLYAELNLGVHSVLHQYSKDMAKLNVLLAQERQRQISHLSSRVADKRRKLRSRTVTLEQL
mmetsp:Transcript_34754/g.61170  ORF Transcript_34754/g.61170 Transcript_34754/m.61170 type:complete len:121 (-) Transcript_34754:1394-1756(-)